MFFRRNTKISEEELVSKFRQSGHQDLLGKLFEPQMGWVFSVCFGYLKNREDAEDAVIQIFEKIGVELKRHEVSNFKSWLHSLTRNHCLMNLRKKKPEMINLDNVFQVPIMDSEANLHQESDLQKLESCIQALKKEQKTVIQLFYHQEKCYQEISNIMKLELKKVKSVLQNGRRMLKNCIEKS